MKSYQQLFAELKRRHVFRVAGIYGIVAFGVLQAADLMLPRLGLPDWTVTFMVAIVVLAFPVVLIIAWAFEVTPDGVQRTDEASPEEIEQIVAAPAANRWPAGMLALVGITALVFGAWWVGRQELGEARSGERADAAQGSDARLAFIEPSDDPRPSIAVLPFADMSSGQDQEYFGDGMAEEIINALAGIRDLRVAGRTSAFSYKGEYKDLREIGTELGVRYLVEGSVRKEDDDLRITAQLIDAHDGTHLWSDTYDRPLTNVFQIQSEIAGAIADALTVPLGLDDAGDLVTPTGDLGAYDLYLAGRARLRARDEGVFESVDLFKAAVARDSTWAPAWAGLADATELQLWYDDITDEEVPFGETLAAAERAAQRALELNPQNSTALIVLGCIHRDRHEWDEAERYFQRALGLDPDNAEAHQQYGEWLHKTGRVAEAVRAMDRASILDPAPVRIWQLLLTLTSDARWAETEGMTAKFVALESALELWPIRRAYAEGRHEEVPGSGSARGRVLAMVASGDADRAAEELVELLRENPLSPDIAWRPYHDVLRDDPRVQAYLASIGLGGVTVQRTPEAERVRPAILRQSDAAARAGRGFAP